MSLIIPIYGCGSNDNNHQISARRLMHPLVASVRYAAANLQTLRRFSSVKNECLSLMAR
jgi:hypothetical protein